MSSPPIVEELNRNDEWVAVHDTEKQDGGLQQGLSRPKAELSNLSTKQMKQLLIAHGVDCSDCVEKDDLVDRLVRAEAKIVPHKFSGAISPPPASGTTSDNSSLQQVGIFKSIPKGLGRSFRKVVKQEVTRGIGGSLKQLAGCGFGSIHIKLPKRHFYSGDNIRGQIKLNLEQPIQAMDLVVSLVGTQRIDSSRDKDEGLIEDVLSFVADQRKTVYKFPVKLETKRVYNPGEIFSFDIPVPDFSQGSGFARLASGLVQALAVMDNQTGEVEWSVAAELRPAASFVPLTESVHILVEEKKTSVKPN